MASFKFGKGKRSQTLASLVTKFNYDTKPTYTDNEAGIKCISQLEAPCIAITRDIVSKAYFGGKPEYEASLDKWMDYYALNGTGSLICQTHDKIIYCDDDGEKAMSLRFKINHQMDIARLSEKLGISRNDFVIRAIEYYVQYLTNIEEMEE